MTPAGNMNSQHQPIRLVSYSKLVEEFFVGHTNDRMCSDWLHASRTLFPIRPQFLPSWTVRCIFDVVFMFYFCTYAFLDYGSGLYPFGRTYPKRTTDVDSTAMIKSFGVRPLKIWTGVDVHVIDHPQPTPTLQAK